MNIIEEPHTICAYCGDTINKHSLFCRHCKKPHIQLLERVLKTVLIYAVYFAEDMFIYPVSFYLGLRFLLSSINPSLNLNILVSAVVLLILYGLLALAMNIIPFKIEPETSQIQFIILSAYNGCLAVAAFIFLLVRPEIYLVDLFYRVSLAVVFYKIRNEY